MKYLRKYDWFFCLTDGSIFYSSAKHSIIHFQVPFTNRLPKNPWTTMKMKSWDKAIYNSNFTQQIVEQTWPFTGEVVYPPVSTEEFKSLPKKKMIINVGRFFGYLRGKKQDVMIQMFKQMVDKGGAKDWSLHLAGSAGEGDMEYVEELKKSATGYDIYIHPNIPFQDLKKLYGEGSIYWHASGFGEDDPKKFEHFGITTVEAMAAGCIPVVINKGGQREIVESGVSGFLWDNREECLERTVELMNNGHQLNKMANSAQERSRDFSKQKFEEHIRLLIK
jgi:glycosyltransferase involved in cell wall biosynthesis